MAETTKIGVHVREELWEEYKEYCIQKNGKEGTVGTELTKLIEEDLDGDSKATMEMKIDTLNAKLDYLMSQE